MKIVFSTDQIYLHGGVEKVLSEKVNYLSNLSGYDIYILTTEQKGNLPCYSVNSNVKCIDLGVNYNRELSYFHPKNIIKAFYHLKKQRTILSTIRPSLIISSNYAPDFYWLPFIFTSIPKWKEYHASRFYEVYNFNKTNSILFKVKFKIENWIASKYNKIVVLNHDEQKLHSQKNSIVIPNPIICYRESKVKLQKKQVIAAGRIAPVKGFGKLILAWSKVYERYPDWELHIYGESYQDTKQHLMQMIEEKNLQNIVHFKGTIKKMTETMLDYSIFVMSSKTECFPMVLLESLSVGLPIVSFNCETGPRNIITHEKEGLLVEDQNIDALADALITLMSNPVKLSEMSENAKKKSYTFDLESIMDVWVKEINKEVKKNE